MLEEELKIKAEKEREQHVKQSKDKACLKLSQVFKKLSLKALEINFSKFNENVQ